nr:unnamed protein product [Callosobruchus analis]
MDLIQTSKRFCYSVTSPRKSGISVTSPSIKRPKKAVECTKKYEYLAEGYAEVPEVLLDVDQLNTFFSSAYNKSNACERSLHFYNNNFYTLSQFSLQPVDIEL